jgi:hypothetical protein
MAKKGSEEARRYFQSGPRKGELRDVPRVAFKADANQDKKGQLRTGGPGRRTSETQLRTQRGNPGAGQIQSTTRSPKFGQFPGKLPPGVNPLGRLSGLFALVSDSSPTNMVTIKDQDGKSQRVPDTYAAKIRDIDALQKRADKLSFDEMFESSAKLDMAGFMWNGKSYLTKTKKPGHKYDIYDLTQNKMAEDKKSGKMPIMYKGSYLGSRPQTVREIKDDGPIKKAPRSGTRAVPLASGGLITRRGPMKRK